MTQSIFANDTDYSFQTFSAVVKDLGELLDSAGETLKKYVEEVEKINQDDYSSFYLLLSKIKQLLTYFSEELVGDIKKIDKDIMPSSFILEEIKNVGIKSHKLSLQIGKDWHLIRESIKENDNKNYLWMQKIYSSFRDELYSLSGLVNIANKLESYAKKGFGKINIFISGQYGIYKSHDIKDNYKPRGIRWVILSLFEYYPRVTVKDLISLLNEKKDILGSKFKGMQENKKRVVKKSIDKINEIFRKEIHLDDDLIISINRGEYELNHKRFEIKFIE